MPERLHFSPGLNSSPAFGVRRVIAAILWGKHY
jgi:hypothetical protein